MTVAGHWPVRMAAPLEIEALAQLWFDGWQDAHADILPRELKRLRTLESFGDRLRNLLPQVRTAGPDGEPLGLAAIRDDELYQLYVGDAARGKGLAAELAADALKRDESRWLSACLACMCN